MRVCLLVAAYNEARSIGRVVAGTLPHVAHAVVVDDGSDDATAEEARRSGAEVIRHASNRGKGTAVRTGLARVLQDDWTHVLFMDGDLQHDPEHVPLVLERSRSGRGDFVIAERRFEKDRMPAARFYSNTIGSRIISLLIGGTVSDSQTGFRLIRSQLLRSVTLTARRYEVESEILIKLVRRGAVVETVAVPARYDGIPSKMRPVRDVFRICMLAMRYRYLARDAEPPREGLA